jgi:hypothetical protein
MGQSATCYARKVTAVHDKPASDQTQTDRFKALARELGCGEDEAEFDAALKKVAETPHQPKHEPKKRKPKG